MFERKLTKAVVFQLMIEELLAPALMLTEVEAECRLMARAMHVQILHSHAVQLSTTHHNFGSTIYLTEVAQMVREALEGSPYALEEFESHPIALRSCIAVTWK